MNLRFTGITIILIVSAIIFFLIPGCQPLSTQFEEFEDGELFYAGSITTPPDVLNQVKVMTWNIRFGAGRLPWFGDSCGDRVILSKDEVYSSLQLICTKINESQPDILLLQELDINSKRSSYINQLQWILDHTHLNYGALGTTWKAQFIPSDGLGRMHAGNVILSRWPIKSSRRIQLPKRGDQDDLTQYFYIQHNMLITKIDLPGMDDFYVCNTHLAAFSTDDTKQKQVDRVLQELQLLHDMGASFILGGDLNLLPPNSDTTDYCLQDRCADESFHHSGDDPFHKEGSNYTPEITWLQDMYDQYLPAVSLNDYRINQQRYFSHVTRFNHFWDRKLDYLFTNHRWLENSDSTHQDVLTISDHAAVSAGWDARP